jgi:DNA repair exonuclease SbcCD ATPase subunit
LSPYENGTKDRAPESHSRNDGNIVFLASQLETNQAEMLAKMEANQEKMMAKLDAGHNRTMARMDSKLETMEACLGETEATNLEASPEEIEFEAEHEEVPKKKDAVETFGALKERYGDWHLAVRCHD